MRKIRTVLIALLAVGVLLQGPLCMDRASGEARIPEHTVLPGTVAEAPAPSADPVPAAAAPEAAEAPAPSGYVFRPRVCSAYMEEIFGETMCETWFHLVDAVIAGEDTFACPDQHTYDWVMGQFPIRCFPVLTELIDYADDREHSVTDGVATFTYLVPRAEAARRIAEFAQQVEGILNDALADADSDFEKTLALYDYFSRTYHYDYETERKMYEIFVDYTTTYRLFETGQGICFEIARAYAYLLMQAGVDATTVMGDAHEWSFVRINGVHYHVDPTFALDTDRSLAYFLMTDERREATGFGRDSFVYVSHYSKDHPHPDYAADDDTFAPLWDRRLETLSPQENMLRCWNYSDDGERDTLEFDYTGY